MTGVALSARLRALADHDSNLFTSERLLLREAADALDAQIARAERAEAQRDQVDEDRADAEEQAVIERELKDAAVIRALAAESERDEWRKVGEAAAFGKLRVEGERDEAQQGVDARVWADAEPEAPEVFDHERDAEWAALLEGSDYDIRNMRA